MRATFVWIVFVASLVATSACNDEDPAGSASGDTASSDVSADTGTQDTGGTTDTNEDAGSPDATADTGSTPDIAVVPDGAVVCTTDADCIAAFPDLGPCEVAICDAAGICAKAEGADDASCDDGDACTTDTVCDAGTCGGGAAVTCEDDNPCTTDACDPAVGCTFSNNAEPCDDGNACTENDTCADGACGGEALDCNDGNACTADGCDPSGGCQSIPKEGGCSDGNVCTKDDYCSNGACQPGTATCPTCTTDADCDEHQDDDLCNGIAKCITGFCQPDPATIIECDTTGDTGCSVTSCVPETGACEKTELGDGDACNDGNGCTEGETCTAGTCAGGKTVCTAGCEPTEEPGCADCACEDCVCALDSFCCDVQWDDSCVAFCKGDCGMDCGPAVTPNDAGCTPVTTPGCGGCSCESCVCAFDSYCCETAWDSTCVGECTDECGTVCGGGGGGGSSSCVGNCGSYAEDCACDDLCAYFGDCCTDFGSVCGGGGSGSCAGSCGGQSSSECWCDTTCESAGDCCSDYYEECVNCDADCAGKECGSDGCGGSCGSCSDGEACYEGACELHCGNGTCESKEAETCLSCPGDCGECVPQSGCDKTDQASCGGCSCEACVCEDDSYCCDTAWDDGCVKTCVEDCGGCYLHEGCEPREEPGCSDCSCQECVCAVDAACCEVAWDEHCVALCQTGCGEDCGIPTCHNDMDCFDGDPCTLDTCPVAGEPCSHEPVEGCCASDGDCAAPDLCSTASCVLGACVVAGGCCTDETECDDADPCTVDTCGEAGCTHAWAGTAECCPEGPVFGTDFETDNPFELTSTSAWGGFQATIVNAASGLRSLWFGSEATGNMNFGVATSTATSALVWLPPSYTLTLTFELYFDTDYDADLALFVVDGAVETEVWNSDDLDADEAWQSIEVAMTAFGGKNVRLRFVATADDDSYAHPVSGIFIDDIAIASDCFFPVCGDGECNGDEDCFTCDADCAFPGDCPANDGCAAWANPTCAGCECETCVCDEDPTCCDTVWDAACVAKCEACGTSCGPDAGCLTSPGPGCGGCSCEGCVCGMDPYCCETAWDSTCAGECEDDCGTDCGGGGGGGGGDADSCVGTCGDQTASGCWCDDYCVENLDCCADYYSVCL